MQEDDGDRLDAALGQLARQPLHVGLVKLLERRAVGQGALRHVEAQIARHERARVLQHQVVEIVALLAPDLDRVAEALGGQQRGPRAFALDDRVGDQRGAVDEMLHLGGFDSGLLQGLDQHGLDRLRRIGRRGQHLADGERAGLIVHHDQIGEGAADVHADTVTFAPSFGLHLRKLAQREDVDRRRALLDQHPAIHNQQVAGDIARIVGGQKDRWPGQLVHLADAPKRDVLAACCLTSGLMPLLSIEPGTSALTRTPYGPRSSAIARVSASIPPLAAS